MESLVDHSAHYSELVSYFASYLKDMSAIIAQVKALAYALISIPQPNLKTPPVHNDIASVMAACKRTFDDIKRTESILRGHVKGKESPASSRNILSRQQVTTPVKADQLDPVYQREEWMESPRPELQLSSKASEGKPKPESKVEEERSTCIVNQEKSEQNMQSRQSRRHRRAESGEQSDRSNQIETKIETLRLSRNKDLQALTAQNDECISLIHKIRNELRIKKK